MSSGPARGEQDLIEALPLPLSAEHLDRIRITRIGDPDVALLIGEIERLQSLCDDVEASLLSPAFGATGA